MNYSVDPSNCYQECYRSSFYTYTQVVMQPSDGLVPSGSQTGQGTAWQRQPGDIYTAQGANHLQEGSHSSALAQINSVFDRRDRFSVPH